MVNGNDKMKVDDSESYENESENREIVREMKSVQEREATLT